MHVKATCPICGLPITAQKMGGHMASHRRGSVLRQGDPEDEEVDFPEDRDEVDRADYQSEIDEQCRRMNGE